MRVACEVEVIYSLSLAKGGVPSKSTRCRASISLGKKTHAEPTSSGKKKEEVYFVVSTSKNVEGTKYKVRNFAWSIAMAWASTVANDPLPIYSHL